MLKTEKLQDNQQSFTETHLHEKLPQNIQKSIDFIPKRQQSNYAPLSFGQQQMWMLSQFVPDMPIYNESLVVRLPGQIDTDALEQSLNAFIERHEIWRTTFPIIDEQPVQRVHSKLQMYMAVIDLREYSLAEQEVEAIHLATEQARPMFDLTNLPLLRAMLIHFDDDDHRLYLTIHRMLFDSTIYQVFLPELSKHYEAIVQDESASLPLLPVQYSDFAAWQREHLQSSLLAHQLVYWKQQLVNAPILELPTDRSRLPQQTYNGTHLSFSLADELVDGLKRLSHNSGTTLYMVLVATFDVLLQRVSGQDDILVGSVTRNQLSHNVQQLVGPCENTLALRTDMSGNPTFLDLLGRVRDVILDAQRHQDLPFDYLVKELNVEHATVRNSLLQALITLEPSSAVLPSGWMMARADVEPNTTNFDIFLTLDDRTDGFKAWLRYNTDLWKSETIQRMVDHWRILLNAVVADPMQHIANLPILTVAEREQLLVTWNDTAIIDPEYASIHHLVEKQVAQTPDATALLFEDTRITYRELNQRANRLARRLNALGVGPDVLVGICMERSIEMVVALLAILKAGGAYVPLDPDYPLDRLAYMIADAHVALVLTQIAVTERIPLHNVETLSLDTAEPYSAAEFDDENLDISVHLENLAYMIYTSGSTGRPKGVMINHQSLSLRLQWLQQTCPLQASDVVLNKTTFSFDPSVYEFFWPLCVGAQILVAAPQGHTDHLYLLSLIQKRRVSVLNFSPSALGLFVQEPAWRDCQSVRLVMCGGEVLPPDVVEQFYAHNQWATLSNMYGPTEATIFATGWQCERDVQRPVLPIGRPVTETEIYLLDTHMQPVPIGVAGELYIGSKAGDVGLARGYFQRPDLTAERFVPHPFSKQSGARLYRTGDLACYREGGLIEFLGRIDQQVKLRGFRIELGEIETALQLQRGIQQAIVIVREDAGNQRLVAYLLIAQEAFPGLETLRIALKDKLPDYMIPAAFVFLDTFPLSPSGKIDRRALPVPATQQSRYDNAFVAPRDPVEEMLALIWADLLNVQQISVYDNFFEIGGHSLLAMQVVSHIRQTLQVEISILNLFEAPTIAGLAYHIHDQLQVKQATSVPELAPADRIDELPASFAQRSQWFLHELDPLSTAYNEPLIVRLDGPFAFDAFKRSLEMLVQRHETLRTTFDSRDGQAIQVIAPQLSLAVPIIDLSNMADTAREEQILRLTQQELHTHFDLIMGPLMRVRLLRLGELSHVLLITCHHIISDGWSVGILLRDLTVLYQSQVHDKLIPLPELPVQYADYTLWQLQWLQDEVLQNHLNYWQQQLVNAPDLVTLPPDRPRPAIQTTNGAQQKILLPAKLLEDLKSLSQQEGVTLYMTLLAAFQVILMRSSDQHDIVVGTPVANRSRREIEDLIGFFVNTLALRVDLSDNPGFRNLLARVREITLQAYAHQDLPFEKVVEFLPIERSLSYSPIFQAMFVMQSMSLSTRQTDDLSWIPARIESTSAKFDLTFTVQEAEQGLWTSVEYNTDLYNQSTINRLLTHWQGLLSSIVQDADQAIDLLPMLSDSEREQILVTWNDTVVEYPEYWALHQLVEQQVERSPEAVAIFFEEQQITYRELNWRANQLAHRLDTLGVGPDVLVGVCMERSVELVIAVLAILKAGGAYVPLDPTYPQDRLAYMITDAQVSLVLTHTRVSQSIVALGIELLSLDTDELFTTDWDGNNLNKSVNMENLAYLIYTSGSTGKPKGAMNSHRNIFNQLMWRQRASCRIDNHDRILQKTPFSFDVSVWELFWPLLAGASLVVARPEGQRDPAYLKAVMIEHAITTMHFVPAMLQVFLMEADLKSCAHLRQVMSGGEALIPELQAHFFARFPSHVRLYNMYGPAEAAIDVTAWECQREGAQRHIPIGYAIANTQLYILDAMLQPVPIGMSGELYIGGMSLARGYHQRPDLTAERFIPNPLSSEPGARFYRTGDLARYRGDGAIEYIGRADYQVKLRGFRIEPGEIEAVLLQQPTIQQAITLIHKDVSGNQFLVAYLISTGEQLSGEGLRTALKEVLPDYMVPTAFVYIDAFPLTPSGKVHRQALPAPDMSRTDIEDDSYVAPTEIIHYQLLNIWEELQTVRPIGIRDNFFHLGGHSLLAARLIARIEQVFGTKISLSTLFAGPTIEDLTRVLQEQTQSGPRSPLIPVQMTGSKKPFFFLHGDWTGGAYYCFTLARQAGPDRPFYVLEPFVFDDNQEIPTIESLASSYLKLIRSVQPDGPYNLGGYCNGGVIAYEIAQQLQNQGEQVDFLALVDPAASSLPKGFVNLFERVLHLTEKQQWSVYLRLRHIYIRKIRPMLLRLSHTIDDQLLKGIMMLIDQDQKFTRLFPPIKTLRKDYNTIFSWALQHYTLNPYPGKATYIWAREALTTGDRDFWVNNVEIKETESHIVPGTHYGILVDEIQTFAESLGTSLKNVPEPKLLNR
jgi:amino acid adenylation domain-containing protein